MRLILCLLISLLTYLTITIPAKASVTIIPLNKKDKTVQDFPFVGSLVNIKNFTCGSGTVIGDGSFVLTSKHVITHNGDLNGRIDDPSHFIFMVEKVAYEIESIYANSHNDIAILKIKTKLPKAVKIHTLNNLTGKEFYGAGFGKSSSNPKYNKIEWDIEYGINRIFKNKIAGSTTSINVDNSSIKIQSEYFFYLQKPGSKEAIEGEGIFGPGDSGGGIFVDNAGQIELIGVIRAFTKESPITGYFVNVYSCKEWISQIVPKAFGEEKIISQKINSVTARNERIPLDTCLALLEKRRRLKVECKYEIV